MVSTDRYRCRVHPVPGRSQEVNTFDVLKLKLEYARAVSQHEVSGKHYEASHFRFKSLDQRFMDTNDPHALLLIVLATEGSLYFDKHRTFAGAKHSTPLIDVVEVESPCQ